jgi:DNA-binding NarL/FixJ family response regulator
VETDLERQVVDLMPPGRAQPGGGRVLLIDDEPAFVESFRRTLEARSYSVVAVPEAAQAKKMIRDVNPDLLVLGTLAPAGEAFSLHQWIRQQPRWRDLPMLVIDARAGERTARGWRREEGMQLQADDYVSKPVEPAALVPRLRELLEKARLTIKVLVADDHAMVRESISAMVALQRGMEVVGEAADGRDAVRKVPNLLPHVVLMDIVMPEMDGLEATRKIVELYPETRILLVTQYDEQENMVVARRAGARGFIPKKAASSELIAGIRSVYAGAFYPAAFEQVAAS